MTYLVATILGFVQGITEFLPISSSGHLILARSILGQNTENGLAFDAILQLATSFALLMFFYKEILRIVGSVIKLMLGKDVSGPDKNLLFSLILGTIPAIVFGFLLESKMETVFRDPTLVAIALVLGSLLIYYAQRVSKEDRALDLKRGLVIGFFQTLALVPGVSRSGATISGGLISGLTRVEAVRFSFLLSLPILFGTGFKKIFDIRGDLVSTDFGTPLFIASTVAFVTSYFTIRFLLDYVKNNNFNFFIWYRIVLAVLIFIFM